MMVAIVVYWKSTRVEEVEGSPSFRVALAIWPMRFLTKAMSSICYFKFSPGPRDMKHSPSRKRGKTARRAAMPKSIAAPATKRASIFRNGSNQAVRLPQELRFPENVKEVRIRKQGDALLLSPVRSDWSSFFALQIDVPDDFLADRRDTPPQSREPL